MGQTTIHHLPYPELPDPADVPTDMRELAEALDAIIPTTGVVPPDGSVITIPVLDTGMAGQYRAGRQLTAADFTSLGLQPPLGLWNLGSLTDASGNGRNLSDKGTVPFGVGINGLASTAAVFAGSTAQALYISDTGAADPFRIRTGSWGCWFRTAKRGTSQDVISKWSATAGQGAWLMSLGAVTLNAVTFYVSTTGTDATPVTGVSDVVDDRWHFVVASYDGTVMRLYVDGVLEASLAGALPIFAGSGPLNIGASRADGAIAASNAFYGRVDEAFITGDVLSEDQVRCLYAAKLLHGLAGVPNEIRLNVHRAKRGGSLAVADFPSQPVRLHNFTAGALTDEGSGNVALTNAYTTLIVPVAGADGSYSPNADPTLRGNAFSFGGAHQGLSATDAGLPSLLTPRSYGCWFKTTTSGVAGIIGWGTPVGAYELLWLNSGVLVSRSSGEDISGPIVADGQWHFAVVAEDNAAGDSVRRKLYLDGRLVAGSTVLNSLTPGGGNRFRIGAVADGTSPFTGQIDGAFVHVNALTAGDVAKLYAKGSQDLGASPKNPGDHVERVDSSSVLVVFDTLQSTYTVDMGVGG